MIDEDGVLRPDSASEQKGYNGDFDIETKSIGYSVGGKNHTLGFNYGIDGDREIVGSYYTIDGDLMLPGGISHASFVERLEQEREREVDPEYPNFSGPIWM
jgi:hypothetical protein